MWFCLNNAFLSAVKPSLRDIPAGSRGIDVLVVRARVAGHIEAVFPDAEVIQLPHRDYRFRAFIPRKQVANAIAKSIMNIEYDNFKNSVPDNDLHDAYSDVWSVMNRLQHRRQAARGNARTRGHIGGLG